MNQAQQPDALIPNRLAKDLTFLSNERTLLTYVRTALAFFATGMALIRFFVVPFHILNWRNLRSSRLRGLYHWRLSFFSGAPSHPTPLVVTQVFSAAHPRSIITIFANMSV
jgi:Domain of unknown function (DUF202)